MAVFDMRWILHGGRSIFSAPNGADGAAAQRAVHLANIYPTLTDSIGLLSGWRARPEPEGAAVFRFKTVPPPRILVVTPDDYECTEPEPAGLATEVIVQNGIVGNLIDVPLCKPRTSEFPNRRLWELAFLG
jgi:hypothetical protein